MKVVKTPAGFEGLTDDAHGGILVHDYSKQTTPPNNDYMFKATKHTRRVARADRQKVLEAKRG
ncbi:hypothetical protein [Ruegeria sp. HKCCA4633]|uniref:hypothetical protein n=1 Tax=Ruegeria sp. HKCCA4633 TaxID=2682983 RepID=UPI0014876C35|nr:hypothetical protein [Ruegeria sp. HKCCA4633]